MVLQSRDKLLEDNLCLKTVNCQLVVLNISVNMSIFIKIVVFVEKLSSYAMVDLSCFFISYPHTMEK